jgi:hypothetical protein
MNAKQVINGIKRVIGVNLETQKLEDGVTVVEADAFEAGYDVFIVMDEERVPLAVGSYTMENGKTLVVETEGVIADVVNGDAEATPDAVADQEMADAEDKPKMIVESKIKETYFSKEMKKTNLEDVTPAEADATVDAVEAVQEEIMAETAEIINELTPDEVTEADSAEMAVAVVEAVVETIEEMPEETAMSFMKKKKKYGKAKMEEAEAEVVAEAEKEIVEAVAEVVNAETPDEVTPEVAEEIAEVVTEAVQEMVADAPEELKATLFKVQKKKESKLSANNKDRVAKAKAKIAKLSKKSKVKADLGKKPATSKIAHNPHKATGKKETFRYAQNAKPDAMSRVMSKMFK